MATIVNSVSIKWRDESGIKSETFKTQIELDIFRKELEKDSNFKLIGESRDVTYPIGYDCYAD